MTKSTTRRELLVRSAVVAAAGVASPALVSRAAVAEDYPVQDLTVIRHSAPGGLIDSTTRIAQPYLQEQGFKTTLEYVLGASGRIARSRLFRSKPDGYTIMIDTSPDEVLGEVLFNGQYKVAEFQPIFGWFVNAFNLFVPKASPFKTLDDLIKTARTRRVTVGTIGKGGAGHLQLAILKRRLNLDLQFVHFDGGAPAYTAAVGGHVEVAMGAGIASAWSETINFLTVFRDGRDPALPDVLTIKELGHNVPAINQVLYANAGPGVPQERIAKLAGAFAMAFANHAHIEQQKKIQVYVTPLNSVDILRIVQKSGELVKEYKDVMAD
jgi:tripartite-type tricarboxylate transporter receptor subunit TctC